MDQVPSKKHSGELLKLKHVDYKNVQPNKIYYIRVRNRDKGKNVRGLKADYVGKIHMIDGTGISFDILYKRNADPRDGKAVWEKLDQRMLILKEAFTQKSKEDNTMFFVDDSAKPKNTTRSLFKRLFGLRKTRKVSH